MTISVNHVLAQVQRWTTTAQAADCSDARLLQRYVDQRDEAAFAALVARHGDMVLRVCRRILGDAHQAEDALQAIFLILARRAHSLQQPDALPAWLYGVARRVALKARRQATGKRFCPALALRACTSLVEALPDPHPDPLTQLTARELLDILDNEIDRLPKAQRSAVILCCLEGHSREEAARILGWTFSSLKSHLQRGRQRLHDRLARRDIALSAALSLMALSRGEAAPALLVRSTVTAALSGNIGSSAAVLAHSVLKTMFLGKFAGVLTVVLAVALSVSFTIVLAYSRPAAQVSQDEAPAVVVPSKAPEKPAARVDRFGDPLPEGALLRIGTIRYRAGAGINHAALSPDGKLLATACESGITFFDLATGKPRHLRESHVANGFNSLGCLLAFSPDGKKLINVTDGGNLRFWDVATGKLLRVVGNGQDIPALPRGGVGNGMGGGMGAGDHFDRVWFPAGSKTVIAWSHNSPAVFIEPSTGKILRRVQLAGELCSVASDGKTLAAIDAKRTEVILYNDAGEEVRRFHHEGRIDPATLCQGGKRLVTVNDKAEIKIWNASTGELQRTIAGSERIGTQKPTVVSITPDGMTLLAGTQESDIRRWDVTTGKEREPMLGHAGWVTGLFYAPNGRSLVSVSWDNMIHRWDLTTGKVEPNGEGYAGFLRVAWSADGRLIAATSCPGRLELWETAKGRRLHAYSLPVRTISQLRFAPDGKHLALACSDACLRLWNVEKERVTREWELRAVRQRGDGGLSWFDGLAWSPDGRFVVTSMGGDEIRMWEASTGQEIWHGSRPGMVAFSPDGKTLVSAGGFDNRLIFQDASTGKVRLTLTENRLAIDGVVFSPDGRSLATCHHGGNVYLRDPETGAVLKTLRGHRGVAWSISFSPDSKWLASSGDETVCIWEVASGAEVLCRRGHEGRAYQAEFGPDGRTVLSSSLDMTAYLWSIRPSGDKAVKRPLNTLWTDLAGEPAKAYRALWELADDPKAASDFLRKKITPAKLDVDDRRLRALLDDLDSDSFAKRESASKTLAAMGKPVEGRLRRAMADAKSVETRHRLRNLLDEMKREPTAEDFRLQRAVQLLELCGTADALRVLHEWAGGAAGALLTEQAKAALERLSKRGGNQLPTPRD